MSPKKLFIPIIILILTAMSASAQHRGVGYSGGGRLPHAGYGGGYRGYGGGYGGAHYGGGGYYGGGRYYGGWGGYRGWGGLSLGFGLGLGIGGYYGGFGYPYGYGYPYYSPYYAYPPVYAQPPVVVQQRNDDYYDDGPAQDQNTPSDPYREDNSNYNPSRSRKQATPAPEENIDDSRPVNPDSLTYKPGTNLSSSSRTYSTRDKVWIKAHWKHTGDGWIWIDGYWK